MQKAVQDFDGVHPPPFQEMDAATAETLKEFLIMNSTATELAIASIDVFFDAVQLVVSLARFTVALSLLTRDAGLATIQDGREARVKVQAWVDEIEFGSRFIPAGLLPAAVDFVVTPDPEPVVEADGMNTAPQTDHIQASEPDVSLLGIRELRAMAKAQGIAKYSRKSKATLLRELAIV